MENSTTCVIDGCDRPRLGKAAVCKGHWQRVYRGGDPGANDFRRAPGSIPPTCSIAGCDRPVRAYGMCAAHRQRTYSGATVEGPIGPNRKAPPEPCAVDGCEAPSRARGWCNPHYQRWVRSGDPLGERAPYGAILVCTVDGCERDHRTGGYCDTHYRRMRRGWDLDSQKFIVIKPRATVATYHAVHMRIKAVRGRASQYVCECGKPAEQWAYQHNDPNELTREDGMPYSLEFYKCYEPMCRSCHGTLDKDIDERIARRKLND